MRTTKTALAGAQLFLLTPALLFMGALVVRELQFLQHGLGRSAEQIVLWYAARLWTLWVLLLALPISVLVIGGFSLLHFSRSDSKLPRHPQRTLVAIYADRATLSIAMTTVTAATILAIVVLHMLAN